jgi:hypothetical protein
MSHSGLKRKLKERKVVQNAVVSSLLQIDLSARTTTPKILVVVLPTFPCTRSTEKYPKIAIFFPENNTVLPLDNANSFSCRWDGNNTSAPKTTCPSTH